MKENQLMPAPSPLSHLQQKFDTLSALCENGIIVLSPDGHPIYVAPSATNVLGYSEPEFLQHGIMTAMYESSIPLFQNALAESLANPGITIHCESLMLKHRQGNWRNLVVNLTNLCHDPTIEGVVISFLDTTSHKITADKLLYANRLYSFLSQINQAIVHTRNQHALFEKACEIAVEAGGFRFAWIGLIKKETLSIEMLTSVGATQKDLDYFTDYTYDKGGPIDRVVNGDAFFVISDIENKSNTNFIAYAHERNFKSAICLPLKKSGEVIGTLNLYSGDKHFFNPQEIELLTEATGDISFALDALESDTRRTIAEEKLKNSEYRLKQAQEIAHLGSWEINFATGIAMWSDEALRIYGLPQSQSLQTYPQWLSYIHPEDLEYVIQTANELSAEIIAFFYRIIRPDGSVRYLFSQTQTEFDSDGTPLGMQGVVHDLTTTKLTEQALVESQANLRLIVDTIPQAIVASDFEDKIVFANKSFASIFGLKTEDVINKQITDLPDGDHFAAFLGDKMQDEARVLPEIKLTDNLNNERVFYTTTIPYTIPDKSTRAVLAIATDITKQKLAEYERTKMVSEIVQRNKDLEQFSYIVSHNLRSPVANIIGLSTELGDENHSDEIKIMLQQQLSMSVARLDNVIIDLNKILQLKTGIIEERESVDLMVLIDDICSSLGTSLTEEQVSLKLDLEVKTLNTLRSFQYSIFYNLISNSIKYRRVSVPPLIEIRSTMTPNGVNIFLKDNGIGFDISKNEEHLFGLYKRFHDHVEGKGLGLFMVKTQVETLGGRISVRSEINAGTEFLIEYDS